MTTRIAIKDFVEIFASETRIVLVEFVILTMMFVSKRDPHRVLFRTLLVKSRTSLDVKKTMIATLVNIATMMMANVDIDLVDGIEAAQVVNDVVVEIVFQSVIGDLHVGQLLIGRMEAVSTHYLNKTIFILCMKGTVETFYMGYYS